MNDAARWRSRSRAALPGAVQEFAIDGERSYGSPAPEGGHMIECERPLPSPPLIDFVLPFYNEKGFIGRTVACLAAQTDRRFRLLLVDNASTDGCAAEAIAAAAAMPDIEVSLLHEPTPGKIFALKAGIAAATGRYLGTIDADTDYPPDYAAKCLKIFTGNPDAACIMATNLSAAASAPVNAGRRLKVWIYGKLLPGRGHSGGFGQVFSREALVAVGGFDAEIWPYVLEDHEIVHRVGFRGRIVYDMGFTCSPSDRRGDRRSVSWTLAERIAYKLMPRRCMAWYLYNYLGPRFRARKMDNIALRSRNWELPANGGKAR